MTNKNAPITLLVTTMPDGSKWGVDIAEIARNRAEYYAHEFRLTDTDDVESIQRSLSEDTLPLFKSSSAEIIDWAENNMNWEDFKEHYLIQNHTETNYQEGWMNGEKEFTILE